MSVCSPTDTPSKVRVDHTEDRLIVDRGTCRSLFHGQYLAPEQQATVREIAKVLNIFSKESVNYVLPTVWSRFACITADLP